jgi:hypothetical protein
VFANLGVNRLFRINAFAFSDGKFKEKETAEERIFIDKEESMRLC